MRIVVTLIMVTFFGSCTTNIYLVRHAEKMNATADTPLSEKGEKRAIALKKCLKNAKIDAIYATDYNRTKSTAKPLSEAIGKPINIYEPNKSFSDNLKQIKSKNVLVVGHSNTIPETIHDLTSEVISISEDDFDNLYLITIRKFFGTKITFTAETYGDLSP